MKKKYLGCLVLSIFLLTAAGIAWYGNCPTLPNTPITTQITKYGATSYFDIVFSDIPEGEFDVANAVTYVGWCIDPEGSIAETPNKFDLYCSVGSSMGDVPWDKINYLLNHKVAGAGIMEIQYAIWHLVANAWGNVPGWLYEHPDYWTETAQGMYNDAATNGENFIPAPGQIVAVILVPAEGFIKYGEAQEMIIELTVPPYQNEGCTPGFWKNHLTSWPYPYTPTTRFVDAFGILIPNESLTLQQALNLGGGGFNKLARHGVAALLSAAHPDVAYPYTVEQVIDAVADAYVGDKNAIEALVMANELGCPLGNENTTASPLVQNLRNGIEKKDIKIKK